MMCAPPRPADALVIFGITGDLAEVMQSIKAIIREMREDIRDIQQRLGITTVVVTHDQEEALTMADRIVVMNQGAIEQVGTPQEIYRHPATAFVADFVGSVNMFEGIVIEDEPDILEVLSFNLRREGFTDYTELILKPDASTATTVDYKSGARKAIEAGLEARSAGRIPRRLYAQASSPEEGTAELR